MYFVLYDLDDIPVCYLEDLDELCDLYLPGYRKRDILRRFRHSEYDFIRILVDHIPYNLYMFLE